MAKSTSLYQVQNVNNLEGAVVNADGTNKVTVFTAGNEGSVLKSFNLASDDTAEHTVLVYVNVGGAGTDRLLGAVALAALSGFDGTAAATDVLRSSLLPFFEYDAFGNRVLYLKPSSTIKIAMKTTAVTAAKTVYAFGCGGDF